ncbi:hypothetical protein [Granulicella tundricola]|uniref:Uncharacterized protein n=1 Tax=Granulicella tundricola (strain ATCC BAA-1859 / DSM 23138 / MP5ACTX9) TaxID=1198114 RepID=E8X525_GRATM|nr:hypothetical protein [Granulicella tundricola]ADW67217.1 hypothetical protein AciX9_0141 [Granulicella tundricola MP5ACTX9]
MQGAINIRGGADLPMHLENPVSLGCTTTGEVQPWGARMHAALTVEAGKVNHGDTGFRSSHEVVPAI